MKKTKFFLFFCLLTLTLGMSQRVSAEEAVPYERSYEGNMGTGFYGSYPIEVPNAPSVTQPMPKPKPVKVVRTLPQTGEEKTSYIAGFGLFFVAIAYALYRKTKKEGKLKEEI